ncbi:E3 ubiquitin-protein ligase TRIM33-like isoform X2 [Mercenaria mercenaria]|uniref:E3 ubiquitin-protein ligase TRIM33-like isoform X2 n=1 Tax=Mercenaria mercenaria TaxID=6596 RepID=UPI00234E7E2E|nr:E3 ubiquitin-protein ligase TRIM33-like isoform X2 [Mercenaria mercenaria]
MAERRKFTENVLGASDEIYDYSCSPCEESGVYKEAHKYCDSCKLYYCKKCLVDHNKFPALRGHLIKEVTSQPEPAVQTGAPCVSVPAPPVEPCDKHPEEMIKMYCGEHDIVCCTVCIALDHRECKDVHYILKLAKDIRTSQEYNDYADELTRIKTVYEDTKQSIQDEIIKMSDVKTEIVNEIKEYKQELVSKIEDLERRSLEKVNERYVGTVLSLTDKIDIPTSILVDESKKQLFVVMDVHNKIYVYGVEC